MKFLPKGILEFWGQGGGGMEQNTIRGVLQSHREYASCDKSKERLYQIYQCVSKKIISMNTPK